MSDPRQTGRGAGARAGGESGEDSTLIRSAKDFYGDDSPTDSSRADRVMGRIRGRSEGGKGQDTSGTGGAGPDRSTGAHVDTGAAPSRAAGGSRGSADSGSMSPSSGNQTSGNSGAESKQPIAAQESKGGRARLGAAAASAGGVVGGLSGRKKSARTGSAAEAVPAPGQSSAGRASASQTGQQTRTAPATADSDSEPTRQIPAQGNRSGRAAGAGAAGGAAAGGAAGAAAARGRADDSHTENTSEPSGLARAETPKKQLGAARRTLKARLRVSQVDPWSVMKTAFLFSFAAGIVLVVAVLLVYLVLSQSGLFVTINQTVGDIISTPGDDTPFDITDYISFGKVLGASFVIGAIDVVIYTALATLGAFLYNLAAATIGGLEVTLAED